MSGFAIKYPFFILMLCFGIIVVGVTTVARMPVDLFPQIQIPVVVVATFYSGMPPQQIEGDITDTFERFFTLGSNIDHIESRSLTGVSLIKVYFQPGTDPDAAVSEIANLAMADLRRLPQGTLPPVVLKFDASNMPVCLVTLKGQGLSETQLHDEGQFNIRNQIGNVPGASIPQPFGGKYRQIQFYVDPVKLEAAQSSPMDVVNTVNEANSILPAGDVRIGPYDYNIYSNSQLPNVKQMNDVPLKAIGNNVLRFGDIGRAVDGSALQYNIVRVDGQKSVYLPILRQGGNSNTIQIVNGIRERVKNLLDIPKSLIANVVFDQSQYVKIAVANVLREGTIGLGLTALMILVFLGSLRGTISVLLSIPISCLAAFLLLNAFGSSINTMVLGGLALVLSRLIDNSVVVLENIFRHLEEGEDAVTAAENGGQEVQLAVLAATFTTAIVFFPVVFLTGVSKYLFSALALGVVLALAASYLVAMSVVPLFCSRFIKSAHGSEAEGEHEAGWLERTLEPFNRGYDYVLAKYDEALEKALNKPWMTVAVIMGGFVLSLALSPLLGVAFFPRTDPSQFVINVKAPSGTRIELTNDYMARVEEDIREVVPKDELAMIVSNIGVNADLSSIYTPNSAMHTAFVQVQLQKEHKTSSFVYMDRVRRKLASDLPELSTFFQTGGLVDSIVNQGMPAPIDIQVSGNNQQAAYDVAKEMAAKIRRLHGVSDVLIPQDLDYPGIQLDVRREMAARLGTDRQGCGRQCGYRPYVERHDRSQLLDRSQERQQLFPHRPVHAASDRHHVAGGLQADSSARQEQCRSHHAGKRGRRQNHQHADRGRSLSAVPSHRSVCFAHRRRPGRAIQTRAGCDRAYPAAAEYAGAVAGSRHRHAEVVPQLCYRVVAVGHSGLPDPDGAIRLVQRSLPHPAGGSTGIYRSDSVPADDAHQRQHHVADGSDDDDRHRGVGLDSDRGVHPRVAAPRRAVAPGHQECLPHPHAAHHDDHFRHLAGFDSPGASSGSRQRAVCAAGPRHHRRADALVPGDLVSGASRLLPDAPQT